MASSCGMKELIKTNVYQNIDQNNIDQNMVWNESIDQISYHNNCSVQYIEYNALCYLQKPLYWVFTLYH